MICWDKVYCRCLNDQRICSCGAVGISSDKTSVLPGAEYEMVEIDVPYTSADLFLDWNFGMDKCGLIKFRENK
jgi:hypothetical protein